MLPHDLKPGRIYNEVSRIGNERARVGKELVNLTKRNKVAILYSIDSQNGLIQQRFDNNMEGFVNGPYESGNDSYLKIINRFYKALYDLNIEADFVFPDGKNFEKYDMIIVPPLYIASDKLLQQLNQYVLNGGHLILNFKSGFADENSKIRDQVMPGALSEICGFTYNEFSSLRDRIPLKGDPFQVGDKNFVEQWAEFIVPTTAKTLAAYDHPFFGKYAAITRNEAGKGVVTYFGTVVSLEILKKVLRNSLDELKLIGADQNLPEKLKVKHAFDASGKAVHFYYNFSDNIMEFKYPYKTGKSIIDNTMVEKNGLIQFDPWDVMIIKEE
ncbi:beta-galactosidase [Pedobacter sp. V48]|uniref:beta-galactosidase n=1 Tax=Pedobacter sp. V48 TaxID=509635 RepID=UPI00358ED567